MFETVSVDQAISRGHKMVSYPGMVIFFGILGLTFLIGLRDPSIVWIWPVGLVSSFLLSWIYWSAKITQWKVWAFENVRNVHELRKRAIQQRLIWPGNSVFNKTEIWTKENRDKWLSLQYKFLVSDEPMVIENPSVPIQTIIYFSKKMLLLEMLFMLGGLIFGIYLIVKEEREFVGSFICLSTAFFVIRKFKNFTNRKPQIVLSDDGIETATTPFKTWKEVWNEGIDLQGSGNKSGHVLNYGYKDGSESLLIDECDIGHKELKRLLIVYRTRWMSRTNYNKHLSRD